mmetsp:Transcript_27433/g.47607  ORF Transcript_27433/g.47607 Transcript_27433/m.47607 type:complete len:249 (+) Transcript_27433:104-850(+)
MRSEIGRCFSMSVTCFSVNMAESKPFTRSRQAPACATCATLEFGSTAVMRGLLPSPTYLHWKPSCKSLSASWISLFTLEISVGPCQSPFLPLPLPPLPLPLPLPSPRLPPSLLPQLDFQPPNWGTAPQPSPLLRPAPCLQAPPLPWPPQPLPKLPGELSSGDISLFHEKLMSGALPPLALAVVFINFGRPLLAPPNEMSGPKESSSNDGTSTGAAIAGESASQDGTSTVAAITGGGGRCSLCVGIIKP